MQRKRAFLALGSTIVTALAAVLLFTPPAQAANLLANPGFESGSLSPWSCSGGLGSVVSSPVHSGTKALQGAVTGSDFAKCTQTVAVVPNTTYSVTAWVRGGGGYVYLGVTGGNSTWNPATASNWTQLSISHTTGASQTSLEVYVNGWYGQPTYNADDISVDGPGGTGVPGAPGNPSVGTITNTSIALSWGASSGTVTGYRVYEGTTVRATVTGTSATISGLTACTSHTYTVAAYNSTGESPKSGGVTATTSGCVGVPGVPGNPTVGTITNTSIALSWGASSGTVTGYRVYEGTTVRATVTGTLATISGLTACTSHTYTVAAYNGSGESAKSGAVTATTTGCGTGVPGVPGNPSLGTITNTSIALSWGASTGTVTGYRVYEGTTVRATVTGTSATISGLTACTSHTYTVAAYNSTGESAKSGSVTGSTTGCPSGGKHAWPYIDVTMTSPTMASIASATGHKRYTMAFIIGSAAGCVPTWGGNIPLNESRIINDINAIRGQGGEVTIAFGGAVGPYLEHVCSTQSSLANAYKQVIDATGATRIDIDVEASVNIDLMNKALKQVQTERPGTFVSFTLMVQGDDYGLNDALGVNVLTNAKANGLNVGLVNPMTMEFGSSRPDWGDAVIAASNATLGQMATIWPEKTDAQRKAMLGVTPMIGRNFNGKIFQLEDGDQLVAWANANHIGALAFWSVGRDNGGCPGGGVSATCSSIAQSTWAFTNKFKTFTG